MSLTIMNGYVGTRIKVDPNGGNVRILNIIQCTNLGGMEQASLRLMIALQPRGYLFQVLSLNPLGPLAPQLAAAGIPAEGMVYRGRGGWRSLPALRRRLRAVRADAVMMTGHHLLTMLALDGVCAGRRLLAVHFHHEGVKPAWQWRLIYRVAARTFQAVTYPSDYIRKEAEALHPPVARISHTVRNPLAMPELPTAEQRTAARTALGLPLGAKIVGNAGWLIQRKRFDIFLRVAQRLAESHQNVCFVIAGDGPERETLQALAQQLRIDDRVRWLGWQNDLASFYLSLDILLFNSDWDAFPTTPLEAMSYAVPVVATSTHGGLAEVMGDGKCGFFFETHDIDGAANAVNIIIHQPNGTVGIDGRERVHEICSVNRSCDVMEQLLTFGRDGGR